MNFTIKGQCPSGKNSIKTTRTGHRYPCERFTAWRDHAVFQIKKQLKKFNDELFPITTPTSVYVQYWASDARRRDVPGIIDAVWHVLERMGIVADDALLGGDQQLVQFKHQGISRDNPRVEVDLLPTS